MSHFKAKMHQIRFQLDLRGILLRGRRGREGKGEGREWKGPNGWGRKGVRGGEVEGRHSLARPLA